MQKSSRTPVRPSIERYHAITRNVNKYSDNLLLFKNVTLLVLYPYLSF